MASTEKGRLVARLTDIKDEVGRLAALPSLNESQRKQTEKLTREFDATKRELDLLEIREAAALPGGTLPGDNSDPMERDPLRNPRDRAVTYRDPWAGATVSGSFESRFTGSETRARALDAAELAGLNDTSREAMTNLIEGDKTPNAALARQILLTTNPDYASGWMRWWRHEDHLMSPEERDAMRAVADETRAMSAGTGSAGGNLLPGMLDGTVIISGAGSQSGIEAVSRNEVVAPGANEWKGVVISQATAEITAEAAQVADASPTIAQPSVDLYKVDTFMPYSFELEATAPNLSEIIAQASVDAYNNLVRNKVAVGTGSSEPWGVVPAVMATAGNRVAATTNDTFGLVDVYALYDALPARHREKAVWVMNPKIMTDVRQFGTANNYHGFLLDLGDDQASRMLGSKVVYSSEMDGAIGTSDDDVCLYGNLGDAFVIARKVGFHIERVQHMFATANNRPTGERGALGWAYIGSDLIDDTKAVMGLRI